MSFLEKNILYIAWVQSLIAVIGSLYFSEIRFFPPCVLCWYQRIFMYPLVILIAVGIIRKDKGVYTYVLPLSILGMIIAFYHNLLYYGLLPEVVAPCSIGASCATRFVSYFGFITIPLLSLGAFSLITICMLLFRKWNLGKK